MKRIYFLAALMATGLFGFEDLGVYGATHQIKEQHQLQWLLGQQEKIDKDKLTQKALDSHKESLKVQSNIPLCQTSKIEEFIPLEIVEEDQIMPYSKETVNKKGKYNILEKYKIFIPKYIFVINADDKVQVELAATYYFSNPGLVDIYVAKGDIGNLFALDIADVYKIDETVAKAFHVSCVPSIVTQQNYKFIITQYNPIDILNQGVVNEN